jgi:hypothetical protein
LTFFVFEKKAIPPEREMKKLKKIDFEIWIEI